MRVVANSIPKSGTHLLLRLMTLLGLEVVDFGGVRSRFLAGNHRPGVRRLLGARDPENPLGIGPHLLVGGRSPRLRQLTRGRGPETVTVGVDSPVQLNRGWLVGRLGRVPEGSAVSAHCTYTPELAEVLRQQKMRSVCLIRDPRAVVVSYLNYVKGLTRHTSHKDYMALADDNERLMLAIRGGRLGRHTLLPLEQRYREYLNWERDSGSILVKFEDIVGSRGGGSDEAQKQAIEKICAHLNRKVSEAELSEIGGNLFGSGRTFKKGQIGGWKSVLSEEHKDAIKASVGTLLVEMGYEKGLNW